MARWSSARASATRRRCSTSARRSVRRRTPVPRSISRSTRSKARRITAKAGPNALAVLAIAENGCLLNAPDTYMEKLAIGPGYPDGMIDLRDRRPTTSARSPRRRALSPGRSSPASSTGRHAESSPAPRARLRDQADPRRRCCRRHRDRRPRHRHRRLYRHRRRARRRARRCSPSLCRRADAGPARFPQR